MDKGKDTTQITYQRYKSQDHSMYLVFSKFITVHPYIILLTNTDITYSHDKYKFININSIIRFRILRAIQNTLLSIH